jgi:hypothetical protein
VAESDGGGLAADGGANVWAFDMLGAATIKRAIQRSPAGRKIDLMPEKLCVDLPKISNPSSRVKSRVPVVEAQANAAGFLELASLRSE